MTRARAAIVLALVFVAGTVSGAVGTGVWLRHRMRTGEGPPGRMEQAIVRRITRRLDLDVEQAAILRRVAADTQGRMEEVRQRALERVGEILDEAYDQLEPTLRPDQKEELDRMREGARSRFRGRRRENRSPPAGREARP